MKYAVWAALLFFCAGCGPDVSDDELGRLVPELPEIPAGYEPYELPDLNPAVESDAAAKPAAGSPIGPTGKVPPITPPGAEE